jgi:hypothetical protein
LIAGAFRLVLHLKPVKPTAFVATHGECVTRLCVLFP